MPEPGTYQDKWKWLEEALIPTMSVSGNYRILFNGNIIAADCCIKRAIEKATELKEKGIGHVDIINIRDRNGVSVWPQKNSEEDIDLFLSLVSAAARQKEFFNNPVAEGEIFKDIIYGKVPALSKFKFLVIYGDPAPGENKTKKSSTKAVFLLGKLAGKLYVIKGFLGRETNATFIEWYIRLLEFVNGKTNVYCYMENNKLQDPFSSRCSSPSSGAYAGKGRYPSTSRGTRRRKRTRPHVSRQTWNPSTAKGTSSSTRRKRTTRT